MSIITSFCPVCHVSRILVDQVVPRDIQCDSCNALYKVHAGGITYYTKPTPLGAVLLGRFNKALFGISVLWIAYYLWSL